MDIVFILLRVITFSWALVLIWRLRTWRGWLYGALGLFTALGVTIWLQAPASTDWLFSPPTELTPTVILISITRLSVVIFAERTVAARARAEQELRRTNKGLEERVEERTKELRQTAVALEKESGAVRQSEEQLRLVTNALPVCIAYADSQQRYLFNNKTYEDWFGRTSDQLKGLTIKEVLGEQAYEAALSGRRISYEASVPLGGKQRDILAEYIPHVNPQGEVKGYVALVTDITELKRAEEQRRTLESRVQHSQKLESLGVLAGGIAHDFNNLLVGMLGNADLALMEMPPESPGRDQIEDVSRSAQRAAELTRQMLAYSGKGKFVVKPLNLSRVVEEMAHLLEVSIAKNVILKYDFDADLPSVEADATQLRQIIMNLIINASEAIGEKSGVVSIRTGVIEADKAYLSETYLDDDLPEGYYVYLEVADTGCGMDAETKSKIFDPFFTTKFTGRGLGLAATLGIVRGHRGALKVHTHANRGANFKVLLPCSAQPVERQAEASRSEPEWRGQGIVLVVDDEESVRFVAKQILERRGFEVLTAEDGREAAEIFSARADEIVLVLLDLTMPHMDGEETFQRLRRIRPDVKTILSSGYNAQDVTNRFAGMGLAGFIQKPYRVKQLLEAVREVLEPAQTGQARGAVG